MKAEEFNKHIEAQIERCRSMLIQKEDYASNSDRLHNFQAFSDLAGITLEQACGGYLGKHIVSIYDMIGKQETFQRDITLYANGVPIETIEGQHGYTIDQWDEKIGDAINYLLILSAIIRRDAVDLTPEFKIGDIVYGVDYHINGPKKLCLITYHVSGIMQNGDLATIVTQPYAKGDTYRYIPKKELNVKVFHDKRRAQELLEKGE